MKIKTVVTIILVVVLFAFPRKAAAAEFIPVSILLFDGQGENYWHVENVPQDQGIGYERNIENAFLVLFANGRFENAYPFPDNVQVLWVQVIDGTLLLNISEEILDYPGGSYFENALKSQIIKTALDINGVDKVTLLIDGFINALPEGSIIEEVTSWPELTGGK